MFRFYNANAVGNFVNDCVVRAISAAEGKTWDETYKELSKIAQTEGTLLDDVNFVENYLDTRYKRVPHCSKIIGEFIEECPKIYPFFIAAIASLIALSTYSLVAISLNSLQKSSSVPV